MINEKLLNILSKKACVCYTEKVFKKIFPKEYNEILKIKFPENFRFTQKLYHYIYDDKELKLGFCKYCNLNRCVFKSLFQGYRDYCCNKCAQLAPEIQQKVKDTLFNNYGVTTPLDSEIIKQRSINTCQKKWGVDNPFQAKENQEKQKETCRKIYGCDNVFQNEKIKEKSKQTCQEKYGVDYYSQTEECNLKIEDTCQKKYGVKRVSSTQEWKDKLADLSYKKWGVKSFLQTQEFQEKANNTKKKNNSFHTSKIEEELYSWFIENEIHVLRQYRSKLYPFACDFYLVDYDLYIEIQGTWTHGGHPFDENNPEDIKKLNKWKSKNTKFYNSAIKAWTQRDVKKRNIAKENGINYLEIFSIDLSEVVNIIQKNIITP